MEEWKDIPGYEGLYQVSSEGRVKSLDRVVKQTGLKNAYQRIYKGKVLIGSSNPGGYSIINLFKNGKSYSQSKHTLVALAFLNPVHGKNTVDHINRNKLDNRVSNLRWANASEQAINKPMRVSVSKQHCIYITKESKYRVRIRRQGLYYTETFNTLQEAIDARNALLV